MTGGGGSAGQARCGRGSGERPGERRPDPPPAPRPSVRAGPLNAAGGGCGLHALPASRRREPRPLAQESPRPARSRPRPARPPRAAGSGVPAIPRIFPYPAQPWAGPRPSRAPAAAKRGGFYDAVTAKWCDRGSCRRGRCAPHRKLRGGSRRRPEGAAEGTESGGRRRAARGSRAEGPRSPPLSMSRAA